MVKLKGPGLALDASGTLADEVTFSKYKGRAYLKTKGRPKQPNTEAQLAIRAMMTFLSSSWKTIPEPNKATWLPLATPGKTSPINAYQAYNLMRWRNFKAPTTTWPATEVLPYSTYSGHVTTGMPRATNVHIDYLTQFAGWGFCVHHLTGVADPRRWDNLIYVHECWIPGNYDHVVRNLKIGTHHWIQTNFSTDGNMRNYNFVTASIVTN